MGEMILLMLMACLFIFGWHYSTAYTPQGVELDEQGNCTNPYGTTAHDREIAWWFRFYIGNFVMRRARWAEPLLKPLFQCVVCMSSLYGSAFYWAHALVVDSSINSATVCMWPVFVVCLAGMNRVVKMATQG